MRRFQVIYVAGDTPYECGRQYGQQAQEKIRAGVEVYRDFFGKTSGQTWPEIKKYAASYLPLLEETMPLVVQEAQGIAEGAQIGMDELMVLKCRYEISKFPKPAECTTAVVLPEASAHGGTYLIKNWDYKQAVMDNIVILHIEQKDGTRILGLAEAGQMLREGFNSHGIGLCNNMIQSVRDSWGIGVPVTFLRRAVLACDDFEKARDMLLHAKRCVSNNMLLASGNGCAVDIEAYPNGANVLAPSGGILTHANHFVVHQYLDSRVGPKNRDLRLEELLRKRAGQIDVPYIMECMKDHEYYPESICAHNTSLPGREMIDFMTVASIIVDFKHQKAFICAGPPCEGEYQAYEL